MVNKMKREIEDNEEFLNKIKAFYGGLNFSEEHREKKEQQKKQEKKEKIQHLENKFGFKYQKHTQVGQLVDKCDKETSVKIFELISANNSQIFSNENGHRNHEIAAKMLKQGADIKYISLVTDLSALELKKLKTKLLSSQ